MTRTVAVAGLLVWAGATLILSSWARLGRPSLAERLRPFHPGTPTARGAQLGAAALPVGQVLRPLATDVGDRLARLAGVSEPAGRRLRRIHSSIGAVQFRTRQLLAAAGTTVIAALAALVADAPPVVAAFLVVAAPVLAFLVVEQRLAARSEQWQRQTAAELPVVAEQLAMLLGAGFSLGAALTRLAHRGHGCIGRDLETVVNRVGQGLTEAAALGEWAELARVESVDRLVSVLTLHSAGGDLGRLVSAEARTARRDLHRRTVEQIERRGQQVWVPVTVATLVPGSILIAVPFLAALRLFANA